jgi:hypothetical protein
MKEPTPPQPAPIAPMIGPAFVNPAETSAAPVEAENAAMPSQLDDSESRA